MISADIGEWALEPLRWSTSQLNEVSSSGTLERNTTLYASREPWRMRTWTWTGTKAGRHPYTRSPKLSPQSARPRPETLPELTKQWGHPREQSAELELEVE